MNFPITPIQKLTENLSKNSFFMKRDDLIPYSFGGNKARKAVLFFQEIERQGCDCVVTYGSSNSNHCRVIANMAASKEIPCHIISPDEKGKHTHNRRMMLLFGARIASCPITDVKETIHRKLQELRSTGFKPYFIQGGGHGNLGVKAYLDAYEEIRSHESQNGLFFDYIFHASGTGTTQAGLICGQVINQDNRQIIGISNARKKPYGSQVVAESVNGYLESIGKDSISTDKVHFIDDYVLDGYGSYNNAIIDTVREVLFKEGIPLDTIYTGKAFWGMKEYIRKFDIKDKNILFIHTGGTPLFFDHLEELGHE